MREIIKRRPRAEAFTEKDDTEEKNEQDEKTEDGEKIVSLLLGAEFQPMGLRAFRCRAPPRP